MKKIIIWAMILGLLVLASLGAGVYYLYGLYQPVNPTSDETMAYNVEKGQTLGEIGMDLETEGIIKSAWMLRLVGKYRGTSGKIQAGAHQVSASDNLDQILTSLQESPTQMTMTILPGWRREEIAEYLTTLELSEFDATEFLRLTEDLEGKLAPDTYKIAPLSTAQTIVNILQNQFEETVTNDEEIKAQVALSGKSLEEVLIIASLLQREAKNKEQMQMIAGILQNRLAEGIPLQLCATAQYAVGKNAQTGKWWEPPTVEDTQVQSPYNTYVVEGLPPGAISTVSLAAIEAALNPIENDYYFYLHDDQGQIHYGKTGEEHQQNVEAYLR